MHTIIKVIEILKQFKKLILAPTCFGSRRNHHQEAVVCLAKTTNMVFLCTSVLETLSLQLICHHNIDYFYTDVHRKTIFVVLAKHRTAF